MFWVKSISEHPGYYWTVKCLREKSPKKKKLCPNYFPITTAAALLLKIENFDMEIK